MPPDDSRARDDLRIGGWLGTFPGRRALPGRPPLVTPPPPRVPVFRPLRPRSGPVARPVTALASVEQPRPARLRIAVTCLAATVAGAGVFLVLADRAGTAPPLQQLAVADPVTLGPMVYPSGSPAATKAPGPLPSSQAKASAPHAPEVVHHTTPPPTPSPSATVVVVGGLRVGATVSLAAHGRSEARARYQHQPPTLGSFVVRRTPTAGCVAFESAGRPGYFLRHRDFVLQLDRTDDSPLFRLDSAFCPVPSGAGTFRLRSANYPDRYVIGGRSGYFLAPVPADRATVFSAG
jgi:hypothetical protein